PPPHDAPRGDRNLLPLGSPQAARRPRRRLGSGEPRRPVLGDEPQALSVRREQRLPQAEAPVLVEDAASLREELERHRARAAREHRRRPDAVPQRNLGRLTGRARRALTSPPAPAAILSGAVAIVVAAMVVAPDEALRHEAGQIAVVEREHEPLVRIVGAAAGL